jgi:hypothetical protein
MCSICIVHLHTSLSEITTTEITAIEKQQWIAFGIVVERFYGYLMSLAAMERAWVFM